MGISWTGVITMKTRWFVAKCRNFSSLESSLSSGIWGCRERQSSPQPAETLTQAMDGGRVVLLFSVNNQHGWHGAAVMETAPTVTEKSPVAKQMPAVCCTKNQIPIKTPHLNGDCSNFVRGDSYGWYQFKVKWLTEFQGEFKEQCLSFSATKELVLLDNTPINKARNFQELNEHSGRTLYELLVQHYHKLCRDREEKLKKEEEQIPPPFFHPRESRDMQEVWSRILEKVKNLGKVLLACAFGSQRYNLHTAESDTDMFIIYAASAKDVLGFNPPKQTIKNRDTETCDYTIHEVFRYCELLLGGDPRCVETLFLHPSCVYYAAEEWQGLCQYGKLFLTKQCLEKYLGDATGSRGLKQLEKWWNQQTDGAELLPVHIRKLFYIVIRLLQNARDVSSGEGIVVYRPQHYPGRKLLMETRQGEYSYKYLKEIIDGLLQEIEANKTTRLLPEQPPKKKLEEWLLELRYNSLVALKESKDVIGQSPDIDDKE
ncbi:uncharacterized protein LOC106173084 isoform X1 [Lingula anatina]|uniref:Uncharacterized protein LOC106173084 isoform X1 n=2 Tax=Lingula anatina TaxID=7574 RepID=A0A1S3JGI9_LINAN|nr:uncharacterized protein LOC106173084 isoform X1 [Lingula anatina]|eukprot:XP_013409525.1 uncharacterized protein LOC106173084 isoform X1 [Lingula anatina]